ncbi:MAG: ATP-binding protein [Candidatus Aminicenantales bacterium]
MRRYLEEPIKKDLREKIVLLSGPRRVGKTTLSKQLLSPFVYLNHDSAKDRAVLKREEWDKSAALVIFDELHKMKNWKSWIKGIFDTRGVSPALLVTGSARLDLMRKGGDSLAGRFFSYRLHPLTVKEIREYLNENPKDALDRLLRLGGFPEPYLKNDDDAARRWRRTHSDTIIRGDLLDLERVRDIKSIEILIDLLRERVGSRTSHASLAEDLQVSSHTIKHWLQILESLCLVFSVRPYHRRVARSLLKDPKYYFYDIGAVEGDLGARLENAVAAALLRELHFIEDTKGSRVALHYLRDKEKNEVDFLAVVDHRPVLMVEVKASEDSFTKSLFKFKRQVGDVRAVQVVHGLDRKKNRDGVDMVAAHDFLAELAF